MNTYVIVSPQGLVDVGLYTDENHAWTVVLGWPSQEDIDWHIAQGWYCAQATVTWRNPNAAKH